ncbi:MAG: PRC-barrel domain-containing protein [Lacipirellulaceae bacterium]
MKLSEGEPVRASQLVGLNITNDEDETVGEINDLVLDDATGKVKYVALSAGGFLGIGDKLFAIPLDAFRWSKNKDNEWIGTLNVQEEDFENVEGFDQDNWPNMADRQWRTKHSDTFQNVRQENRRGDKRREDRDRTERRKLEEEAYRQKSGRGVYRVSQLMGLNIGNGNDETVGEINDLVFGARRGKALYVALEAGGTLGIGDGLFAVPFDAFNFRMKEGKEVTATLNATKQQFENAEGFDTDNWPNMADQKWKNRNDRSYATLERYDRYDGEQNDSEK